MVNAFIIVFREGFEAFLIVAIIFAYLRKTGRDALRPAVWSGIAASVVASFALGYWLQSVNQPLWEGILALVAAVLVATFVIHVWRMAPRMKQTIERGLEEQASRESARFAWVGVFGFTLLMITREGMETALMLIQVRQGRFWLGCALGLLAAAAMSWLWAHFGHRVNIKRFFQVTGLFLLLFTVQIVFYAIHEFSEAEILPNSETIHHLTEPYSADGRYSIWIMFGMVALCAAWLAAVTFLDRRRAQAAVSLRPTNSRAAALVVALLAMQANVASAATVAGKVLDAHGTPVPGAIVTLIAAENVVKTAGCDRAGRFSIPAIKPGAYLVSASSGTFGSPAVSRSVEVRDAGPAVVDMTLPLAGEQITVVGRRIAATPERIPGSVTILGREVIEATNPVNLTEVLRKAAGVNVRDEEGLSLRPNIGLRGLNPTRSSKVLLLEDGLPLTFAPYGDNASYYHPPLERFDSIEIVKGSGQVAYGPATIGGVINYLTPDPPASPTTKLKLTGGTRGYLSGHLTWGGTWGETGVLLDLVRKQADGSRENIRSRFSDVNAKVVHAFSDVQTLTLRANYYDENSNVTYSGLREAEFAQNPRQNPFRNDVFLGDRYGVSLVHRLRIGPDAYVSTSVYGSNFKRHWWRQSSNSAQRPNDAGDPTCGGMTNLNTTCGNEGRLREYRSWGVEPRLTWSARLFGLANELQAGVRAHFEDQQRLQVNGDSPRARSGRIVENNARNNDAFSAFVQNRLTYGDWSFTPGLRVERIAFERLNRLANSGAGATGETTLTQLIPGIGVSYVTGTTTFFGGIHRGFAPPRTEDIITNAGGLVDLDPELSWNSEIGVRSSIRPGLQFESTLFQMDYENQIIPASVAGGVGATLTNAGSTLHRGFEIGGRFDSAAAFGTAHNAYMTLAYTNVAEAKFTGRRFSSIPGSATVSVSGNRLPYAPKTFFTAGAGYLLPTGADCFVEAIHVGRQFGDDLNTVAATPDGQRGLLPAYTIWNATVNYEVRPIGATVFVSVKNLFDHLYIADRSRGILPGPERQFIAGLSVRR